MCKRTLRCELCGTLPCLACTMDNALGHQPKFLTRVALAKHAQCLVVAREVLFACREKRQKAAATRLEDQSIAAAVDKATEVHRTTEQEFQHLHKLLSQREAAMHMQIATLSDRKKHSMLHGPRAITKMWSL